MKERRNATDPNDPRTNADRPPPLLPEPQPVGAWAEAGRRTKAVAAIEEAITVYRRLAVGGGQRGRLRAHLASLLNSLSIQLAEAGRREEVDRAHQEVAEIERRHKPAGRCD